MNRKVLTVSVSALVLGAAQHAAAQLGAPTTTKAVTTSTAAGAQLGGTTNAFSSATNTTTDAFKYADMNDDGVLNVVDFNTFLKLYALGNPVANCDNSTAKPTLNAADFTCFLQAYATAAAATQNQQTPGGTQDQLGQVAAARPKTPAGIATNSTSLTATNTSGQ